MMGDSSHFFRRRPPIISPWIWLTVARQRRTCPTTIDVACTLLTLEFDPQATLEKWKRPATIGCLIIPSFIPPPIPSQHA